MALVTYLIGPCSGGSAILVDSSSKIDNLKTTGTAGQ